jgi:hypothetical protein
MNAAVAQPMSPAQRNIGRHNAPERPFREVWLITLGHGLTHWYPATFYMLLPIIGRELDLSYGQIGFIMTCQYIAGATIVIANFFILAMPRDAK